MSKAKAVRCTVHGRVQGVGFRYTMVKQAQRLGLTGWIRNDPDGTVEVVAEGDEQALRRFVEKLKKGPPAARVTDVDVSWGSPTETYDRFTVAH